MTMTPPPTRASNRTGYLLALVAALALIVAALWLGARPASTTGEAAPSPSRTGTGTAAAVVMYVDPQCPICAAFERTFGAEMNQMVADGRITLTYHVMSFLDGNLHNDSSSRAANAMFCAQDAGKMNAYVQAVFAGQPATEGAGFTDAQLAQFASQVGISGDALTTWNQCATSRAHAAEVVSSEQSAESAGITGTPTLQVDGSVVDLKSLTATNLAQTIAAAHR